MTWRGSRRVSRVSSRPEAVLRLLRLARILSVVMRYGLDEFATGHERVRWMRPLIRALFFWRRLDRPRGERLRQALEELGPIFVKFGQVLSTRRDLLPADLAEELAKLQDRVPPFPADQAIATLERAYGKPVGEVFARFDREPVASASVAQVHFAALPDGREAAVKILRPGLAPVIARDIALLETAASLVEAVWRDGRRLRPREVIAEFRKHLRDELDLQREAASASQLRRNFRDSPLLRVPEVYWDWCLPEVMVMERMHGTPISQVQTLREQGIDIARLSRTGVEIFFTQVFRDGFFHADMHPGNIQVSLAPQSFGRYIALDFGIIGTLTERDKDYLAQNFIAFFRRDYKRVAELHVESGWVPASTRVDALESAIRAVCEPQFERPLKDISLGQVLLRLFQTSRRFNVEIQPQLVLLQKTLLNVEGLGRQLDPDLDLWTTAKPFLERWMSEQVGWRQLLERFKAEAPRYAHLLPELPRLAHAALQPAAVPAPSQAALLAALLAEQRRTRRLLQAVLLTAAGFLLGMVLARAILVP